MAVAVAINIPTYSNPIQRTVASGNQISQGTILKLAEPNTASASTGTGDIFGGIAAFEKSILNGDVSTSISAWMTGIWDLTVNAGVAITTGNKVTSSGANLIRVATEAEVNAGQWIGVAEEDGATGEAIRVSLRGY